jgi:hypothetical protein
MANVDPTTDLCHPDVVLRRLSMKSDRRTWEPSRVRKNPAAVALGKLGGSKGGKMRAERLSAEQRTQIARKAAQTRWKQSR